MVVGEILAGLLLGPSLLKHVWPSAYQVLAPHSAIHPHLTAFSALAVTLLLFSAGMETDVTLMRCQIRKGMLISLGGFILPFIFGFTPSLLCPQLIGLDPGKDNLIPALFLGTAFTITGLPVLVKILIDLDIYATPFGMMTTSAALATNLMSWTLVGIVSSLSSSAPTNAIWQEPLLSISVSLLFVVLAFKVGRRACNWLFKTINLNSMSPGTAVGAMIALGLLGASFTKAIGVNGTFGAFIMGTLVGSCEIKAETRQNMRQFVFNFLGPIYFAFVGLSVDFVENFDLPVVLFILILACTSKILGSYLMARQVKLPATEALASGLALNSRGALVALLATTGLAASVINERTFVALTTMAILTSLFAGIALSRISGALTSGSMVSPEGA
jgi:Kef-type K+ transport system membrane component KefB